MPNRRTLRLAHAPEQDFRRRRTETRGLDVHRSERRIAMLGCRHTVEADHREIPSRAHAALTELAQRAERDHVVVANGCVRRLGQRQHLSYALAPAGTRWWHIDDPPRMDGKLVLFHRT